MQTLSNLSGLCNRWWSARCAAGQGLAVVNARENLRNQGWIFSAGENEGTVYRQGKKCLSEAAARAGYYSQPATTRADRHAGKASCAARKPPCRLSRRSGQVSISIANTRLSRCNFNTALGVQGQQWVESRPWLLCQAKDRFQPVSGTDLGS